ncbi:hypothetical protein AGOR_G00207590 [Albula goreensis]|uniref:Uncharacterized protein n=1 Tax=Albula goreensis TaxID=1534307 RepID=A0A8T3CPQ6_9TELE|nr:hypothetical protein AGOR_G00207590 [Albula goreensis]
MIDNPPASQPESDQLKPCHWGQKCRILPWLICLSFISILLGLGLFYHTPSDTASSPEMSQRVPSPCLTPACLKAAARLSITKDPFIQPCEYFLGSCGAEGQAAATRGRQRGKGPSKGKRGLEEWAAGKKRRERAVNSVTDTQTNTDTSPYKLSDRQTALLQVIREILESPNRPGPANSAEKKVRRFYSSCMDTKTIEQLGSQPVLKLIDKLGGWALSGKWKHSDFNFTLSLLMKEYSTFPFFNVYVGRDPENSVSDRKYVQIDQPEFQIPVEWDSKEKKSKLKPQNVQQFLYFHLQLLGLLGVHAQSTNLHTGLFLQLSSQLALASSPLSHRLQKQLLYQRMTVSELQAAAPAIDWLGCLQATFHPLPILQSDQVLLHNLPYITHMSRTISKWQQSQEISVSDPLHTFMVLSLLHKVMPALNSKFTDIQRNLSIKLGETQEVVPLWKKCVLEAEKGFDTVMFPLLRERVGAKEAEEMMQDIYSSLKSRLSTLKWRDKKSHSSVLNRVGSLTPRLSTNKEILSQEKIEQQYSGVPVSEDAYFSNYLQLLSLQRKRRNKLFSQTSAPDILSFVPSLSGTEMNIPLGMFAPPFFHPSYPRAVNYGILGTLMAKEILKLLLPDVQSQSESPQRVSECVWAHYLRLTESSRKADPPPLTPSQQQEIWAYSTSLLSFHGETSLSNLSHTHLFLTSFAQINCDSDPFNEPLPFEPLFLVTVICMSSDLCPRPMTCSYTSQQTLSQEC